MPLKVRRLSSLHSFQAYVCIQHDAFPETDILHQLLYPCGRPSASQLQQNARDEYDRSIAEPARSYIQCVDEDIGSGSQSIAWALYSMKDHTPEMGKRAGSLPRPPPQSGGDSTQPKTAGDLAAAEAYNLTVQRMQGVKIRHIKEEKYICKSKRTPRYNPSASLIRLFLLIYLPLLLDVHCLATNPSHRRRGAATILLRHIIGVAREQSQETPIYVMASPYAYSTYVRLGFLELERTDLGKAHEDDNIGDSVADKGQWRALMVWKH